MVQQAAHDRDGDGAWGQSDVMGVTSDDPSLWTSFMTGCGERLTRFGEGGKMEIALRTEKMQNVVEKITALVKQPGAVNKFWENKRKWEDGNTLFYLDALDGLRAAGDLSFTEGILPYPKYDEAQDRYYSLNWNAVACVPNSIQDPSLVGAALEYAAWESANEVIPAYFDITLGTRYAKDEATRDMLHYILDNSVLDAGATYLGMTGTLAQLYMICYLCLMAESTDMQSYLAMYEGSFLWSVEEVYSGLAVVEAD